MRLALACLLLFATPLAAKIALEPPGPREFVADHAGLLTDADKAEIVKLCNKLLTDKAIPIIVVTIDAMSDYTKRDITIEQFAQDLYDQWGIGHPQLNQQEWNMGMLLLVSKSDRRARIEFGAGLGHRYDSQAQIIMDTLIIPQFKAGNFSVGIAEGVRGLESIARDQNVPAPPIPVWFWFALAGFIGLMIFTVVSLVRRGSSGWAWVFWGVVFTVLGFMLVAMLTRRSGGGFRGGSFGGGFSGGGGASGRW